MKRFLQSLRQRKNIVGVLVAGALIGYLTFLILANYASQMDLRRSSAAKFLNDEKALAQSLSHFFSEQKREIGDLAQDRVISIYFENQALGMSMAYGLRASLIGIEGRFRELVQERRLGESPIYDRILFLGLDGAWIAAWPSEGEEGLKDCEARIEEGEERPSLIVDSSGVAIYAPCRFKERRRGDIAARINMKTVHDHFLDTDDGRIQRMVFPGQQAGTTGLFAQAPSFHGNEPEISSSFQVTERDGRKQEYIAFRVPVQETPFALVTIMPGAMVYGDTHPRGLLFAMGILGFFVLWSVIHFFRMNTRNLVLEARLEESAKQQAAIQQKNLALEEYRQNLEKMVEERTAQLRKAQEELVRRATEAGRSQMAAVVLHNIGNAITPAKVHVENMGEAESEQIVRYLQNCYEELKGHREDLTRYISLDARGKEVFAYMETLIQGLAHQNARRLDVVQKIQSALSYVSEILTLQQAYGSGDVQITETLDLNRLVEDALSMQGGNLQERNIQLSQNLVSAPVWLRIDKNRTMQTLVNLIRNSCEAIDQLNDPSRPRQIQVKTFQEDGKAGFEIMDTGIGIEGDTSVFFEFGKSLKGSSGFGLTYCKEFVEANNGHILLTSPGIGQGTTVRIEFPSGPVSNRRTSNIECQRTTDQCPTDERPTSNIERPTSNADEPRG